MSTKKKKAAKSKPAPPDMAFNEPNTIHAKLEQLAKQAQSAAEDMEYCGGFNSEAAKYSGHLFGVARVLREWADDALESELLPNTPRQYGERLTKHFKTGAEKVCGNCRYLKPDNSHPSTDGDSILKQRGWICDCPELGAFSGWTTEGLCECHERLVLPGAKSL